MFEKNLKAYLSGFALADLSGHEKFLLVAGYLAKGKAGTEVSVRDIIKCWPKGVLRIAYNSKYYFMAQKEGWVDPHPSQKGRLTVTDDGIGEILGRNPTQVPGAAKAGVSLIIFDAKSPYSFDAVVRKMITEAKREVIIADSYVGPATLDLFRNAGRDLVVKILFMRADSGFDILAKKFLVEFKKSEIKLYQALHDRFIVVDAVGHTIGPSLKDAAANSPATMVRLGGKDSGLLRDFFFDLWKVSKRI